MNDPAPWEIRASPPRPTPAAEGPFEGMQQEASSGPAFILLWTVVLGLGAISLLAEGGSAYSAGLVMAALAVGIPAAGLVIGLRPEVKELRVASTGIELRFPGRRWAGAYFVAWREIRPVLLDLPGDRPVRVGRLGWISPSDPSSGGIGPTLARYPRSRFWLIVPDPRFPPLGSIWLGLDTPALSAVRRFVRFGTYRRSDDDWGGRPTWTPAAGES